MRRRMEQLLNGTFEYETPKLLVSGQIPGGSAEEGDILTGTLKVSHPEGKRIRGFVYSSNPRLTSSVREFYDKDADVRWQLDLTGLKAGDAADGEITFCTELGEKEISYSVKVQGDDRRVERMDSDSLANLAEADFPKACGIFSSESFGAALGDDSPAEKALWEALRREPVREHALEQFLTGTERKEPIELSLSEDGETVDDPEGTVRHTLTIARNTWGYLEIDISSDSRFLRVEKHKADTREFIGSTLELGYIIDANFLHAGRNWGRITVSTCYQTLTYEVCVRMSSDGDARAHRVQRLMRCRSLQLYLDYRLGRIDARQWAERTLSVTGSWRRAGGRDIPSCLMSVFAMRGEGKRAAAERELRRIENEASRSLIPEERAAWLYLSASFSTDQDYINRARSSMRTLALERRSSWFIRWTAMYMLEDEAGGDSGKLETVLRQTKENSISPVMLLEGAEAVLRDPFLLREWSPGAAMIVNFAVKNNMANERLILHSMNLIRRAERFDSVTFRMLRQCYGSFKLDDVLSVWTQMAIAGDKKSEKYFNLYQAAVSRDLRITGLYEYYMQTMGEVRIEQMPRTIRRFFVMYNALDWRKRAKIYRNLSDSSDSIPQVFSQMKPYMESFILDQISMSHINDDLAALASRYLTRQMITGPLAGKLLRLLFTFEIECRNPVMKNVVISDIRLERHGRAAIYSSRASAKIYSGQSCILLEDGDGHLYAAPSLYLAHHILDDANLLNICLEKTPDEPDAALFFALNNPGGPCPVTHRTLRFFENAMRQGELSEEYKKTVRSWLLDYYSANPAEESLRHFLDSIDTEVYAKAGRGRLLSLLAQTGMYEKAWPLVEKYGTEGIDLNLQVRILSQTVLGKEYEEDDTLLGFCAALLEAGMAEEHILSYLLMYYEGPVRQMKEIWRVGRQFELDTMNIEKKILGMIVFTRSGTQNSEQIFTSYRKALGNRRLCQAYVILRCYEYLVRGMPVRDVIFDECQSDYERGIRLPDVCMFALLQHLSSLPERTKQQDTDARSLLSFCRDRDIRFAFFRRFPADMTSQLSVWDKVYCETVADPAKTVVIHYRMKGEDKPFSEEVMNDMFAGIRVKEFVLFEGEELECYTEEINPDGEKTVSPYRYLKAAPVPAQMEDTGYGRINAMARRLKDADTEGFNEDLRQYRALDALTEELFTLI